MTTNENAFKTTEIRATSRASIKIGDSFYTFEATETRSVNLDVIDGDKEAALNAEKLALWDSVNGEVDNQIIEISDFLKKKR